jgi:hypothetical protein
MDEALAFWRGCIAAPHIDLEPLWDYGPFQELIAPRG